MLIDIRDLILHPHRDVIFHKLLDQKTRLCVRAKQYRKFREAAAILNRILYGFDQEKVLFLLVLKRKVADRLLCALCGVDLFCKTLLIVADQIHRSVHDVLVAAVVGIQKDRRTARILLRELQHDLRLGTTKPVDGLVIVPDNKEVVLRAGKHTDDVKLQLVDVLKLIDQYVLVLVLPRLQNIRPLVKQFVGIQKHIIKIEPPVLFHIPVVLLVDLPEYRLTALAGIVIFQCDPVVFDLGYLSEQIPDKLIFIPVIKVVRGNDLAHELIALFLRDNIGSIKMVRHL